MLNPITIKRFRRFRAHRRAWYSFLCLTALYVLSLGAEFICNGVPIIVRHNGSLFFPVFKYYPDDAFTGSGLNTRTDYRALEKQPAFAENGSWMLWPLLKSGPNDIVSPEELAPFLRKFCTLEPIEKVCAISIDSDLIIRKIQGDFPIAGGVKRLDGASITACWKLEGALAAQIKERFKNVDAESCEAMCKGLDGLPDALLSVASYKQRSKPLRQLRLTVRVADANAIRMEWQFENESELPIRDIDKFRSLPDGVRRQIIDSLSKRGEHEATPDEVSIAGASYKLVIDGENVRFPFRPVGKHFLGIDDAGRDVLARLIYALRTSLSFGLILVCSSMFVGSVIGLTQGFAGGIVDLGGQRFIEIWSALPFLYVVILMGSIYGPGFWLMIFCYALFNWISISYYMRAEMLRLRKQPFVEAARCLGLSPVRIVLRHVLPNAMVPLITFFPFSLVGAIGSLAALDYLGFGLPPPTPSIGQLLQQAQAQRWAWWLILYPSLTLFIVMILGVFVGEGIRDAFDPHRHSKMS